LLNRCSNSSGVIPLSSNSLEQILCTSLELSSDVSSDPAFYQIITVKISMLHTIKHEKRKPFGLRFSSLFQPFGLLLDFLIVKHSDIHSNLFHEFKPQFITPINMLKQRQY